MAQVSGTETITYTDTHTYINSMDRCVTSHKYTKLLCQILQIFYNSIINHLCT